MIGHNNKFIKLYTRKMFRDLKPTLLSNFAVLTQPKGFI